MLVVEDVHWADEALLDFVEHLLDWAAPVPLLVLATARPELYDRRPGWSGGKRNATTVSVSPLSPEDTARLLQSLLERALLPADTQASILERAGGNPLYAEQFARMLSERGERSGLPLPEGVQALIAARLDTLPVDAKALLQDASVVGRVFWSGAVAFIGGRDSASVQAAIRELVRREFVRPVRVSSVKGEDEFSIWHALVRDVAYQQIPRARRAEKHVAAAAWIEETAQERVADHSEILVHHYEQALELGRAAGDIDDADELAGRFIRFSVLAGDRAMSLDIPAAEGAYRRALTLLDDGPQRAAALVKLGDALQPQGRLPESEAAYEEAIPMLRVASEERAAAVAMGSLSRALWRHGETARAREHAAAGVALLQAYRNSDLVLAYSRLAALDVLGGRAVQGLASAERAIELAAEIGFENTVRALGMRGIARFELGDTDGLGDLQAAVDLALELGLPAEDTAIAYGNLGEHVGLVDGVAAGRTLVEAGLEFARSRGHLHHEMYSRGVLLWHLFHEGRWDHLLEESDAVVAWDRERGGTQLEPWVLADTGRVVAHRRDASNTVELFSAALARAREIGDPQTVLPLLATAALLALAREDLAAADELLTEYEERSRPSQAVVDTEKQHVWVAMVALEVGGVARAEAYLNGRRPLSACGRAADTHARALVAEASGRSAEAAPLYAQAAAAWKAWGSIPLRAYALLGLGACSDDESALVEGREIFAELRATPVTTRLAPMRQQQV